MEKYTCFKMLPTLQNTHTYFSAHYIGIICCNEGPCQMIRRRKKEEKKNYARMIYQHECEPIIQMFHTTSRDVQRGVMPLLGGGLN